MQRVPLSNSSQSVLQTEGNMTAVTVTTNLFLLRVSAHFSHSDHLQ